MTDLCPTCFRERAKSADDFTSNVCTAHIDRQRWRRTECFNRGIAERDQTIASLRQLLQRAEANLKTALGGIDLAIEQTTPAEGGEIG